MNPRVARWLACVLALFAIAALALVLMRANGRSRYAALMAELGAAGEPVSFAAWYAAAPQVDHDRQERLASAVQAVAARPWAGAAVGSLRPWQPEPPPAAALASARDAALADHADIDRVTAILGEGPVLTGGYGWLRRDIPDPGAYVPWQADTWRRQPIGPAEMHALVQWWKAHAEAATDPLPDLAALDRFLAGLGPPSGFLDAANATTASSIRDAAWTVQALRDRVPSDRLQAWLGEPARQLAWTADGLAAERIRSIAYFAEPGIPGGGMGDDVLRHGQVADAISRLRAIEGRLRGGPAVAAPSSSWAWTRSFSPTGRILAMSLPSMAIAVPAACETAGFHRLTRAGVALCLHIRATGTAPPDQAAAWAVVPAAVRDAQMPLPALSYERLGPTRFRIGMRAADLPADLVPPAAADTGMGQPATTPPALLRRWSLEVDGAAYRP